jgi:DNA-binding transcriptional regulator YhcF (GntR family)
MSSIANMLQVPRETVRRKTLSLEKKKILKYVGRDGVQLGPNYKTIYKDFVSQTTVDLSKLIKRWKQSGIIDKFLSMSKISDNL